MSNKPMTVKEMREWSKKVTDKFDWENPGEPQPIAWLRDPAHFPEHDSVVPHVSWTRERLNTIPLYTTPPQRKPLTDQMVKRMKENCESMEMRGAFADGWLSAEAAHGIKE